VPLPHERAAAAYAKVSRPSANPGAIAPKFREDRQVKSGEAEAPLLGRRAIAPKFKEVMQAPDASRAPSLKEGTRVARAGDDTHAGRGKVVRYNGKQYVSTDNGHSEPLTADWKPVSTDAIGASGRTRSPLIQTSPLDRARRAGLWIADALTGHAGNARSADWLLPWKLGELESRPERVVDRAIPRYLHHPDRPTPGRNANGVVGESFRTYSTRFLTGLQQKLAEAERTGRKTLHFVAHTATEHNDPSNPKASGLVQILRSSPAGSSC